MKKNLLVLEAHFETTLEKSKSDLARTQNRLDRIYEDKLDNVITAEQYQTQFRKYSADKKRIPEAIENHSKNSSEYFELANGVYELGQNGQVIYKSANPDQKRDLIKLVFDELKLDGIKVKAQLSKPFECLANVVQLLNEYRLGSEKRNILEFSDIFSELKKTLMNTNQNPLSGVHHSVWLSGRVAVAPFGNHVMALAL